MSTNGRRRTTRHTRDLLSIADMFASATGVDEIDPMALTDWAVANGLADLPRPNPRQVLARRFARAMREDFIVDENGDPVRHRLAYLAVSDEKQGVFFFKMEEGTPEKVEQSAQWRRRGIVADCVQLNRDLGYYNRNYNPGEPVQVSFNFEADVVEREESNEYDDTPPDDPNQSDPDQDV